MKHSSIMRMLFLTHSHRRSSQLTSLVVSYRPPILLFYPMAEAAFSLSAGGGFKHSGTPLLLSNGLWSSCGRVGGVVPYPDPSVGAWVPYHKAAGGICVSGDLQLPPALS